MVRFTQEQVEAVRGLEGNERIVIRGAAGTGKTFIAVAAAQRASACGERVLFVCASNALARNLAQILKGAPNVRVAPFQALCADIIRQAGVTDPLPPGGPDAEYTNRSAQWPRSRRSTSSNANAPTICS